MSGAGIEWAPKLHPNLIRRLYEMDARGIQDEKLIDQVAYALYSRCLSILEVTRASHGIVCCPACRQDFDRTPQPDEQLLCPNCGWRCAWRDYQRSYRGKQIHGGGAVAIFEHYVAQLPQAASPQAKVLLVDWIVHQCHQYRPSGTEETRYTRPVAANLLQGTTSQLIAFLDDLAGAQEAQMAANTSQEAALGTHYPLWRRRVMSGVPGVRSHALCTEDVLIR